MKEEQRVNMNAKLEEEARLSLRLSAVQLETLRADRIVPVKKMLAKALCQPPKMVKFQNPDPVMNEQQKEALQERLVVVQSQAYEGAETSDEMYAKIKEINNKADEIA